MRIAKSIVPDKKCRTYCGSERCNCAAGADLRRLDDDMAWAQRVLNDSREHAQIVRLEDRLKRFNEQRKQLLGRFPS